MLIERINKNRPSWRNNIPSDCKLDGSGFDSYFRNDIHALLTIKARRWVTPINTQCLKN